MTEEVAAQFLDLLKRQLDIVKELNELHMNLPDGDIEARAEQSPEPYRTQILEVMRELNKEIDE